MVVGSPPAEIIEQTPRVAISNLKHKSDIVKQLELWNAEFQPNWTCVELRATLKDLYEKYPLPTEQRSIMTGYNLEELRDKCTELNVNFTQNMTRGQLMIKIRAKLEEVAPLRDVDEVTFGKYKGQSYATAAKDKAYVKWVLEMDKEDNSASPGLRRLAEYLRIGEQGVGLSTEGLEQTGTRPAEPVSLRRPSRRVLPNDLAAPSLRDQTSSSSQPTGTQPPAPTEVADREICQEARAEMAALEARLAELRTEAEQQKETMAALARVSAANEARLDELRAHHAVEEEKLPDGRSA